MTTPRLLSPAALSVALLWLVHFSDASSEEGVIGYGYKVISVGADSTASSLTAKLQLIKQSSVFGPDIPTLNLVARYGYIHFSSKIILYILLIYCNCVKFLL